MSNYPNLRFEESKELPFSAAQIFQLVADIKKYPEFLPWCLAARVKSVDASTLLADLVVGHQLYRETFTSAVTLIPHQSIEVTYQQGPFHHLKNCWAFEALADNRCLVHFLVDFKFKNPFFQRMMSHLLDEAARRMVTAFEERAKTLYE